MGALLCGARKETARPPGRHGLEDTTPPADGLPVEPLVAENPVVIPRVANLIHRLSMSRDERRQHEPERSWLEKCVFPNWLGD